MKNIDKIENVSAFSFASDTEIILLLLKIGDNHTNFIVFSKDGIPINGQFLLKKIDNFFLIQVIDSSELQLFSNEGKFICYYNENFNLGSLKIINQNSFLIASRKTKTYWTFNKDFNFKDTGRYFRINHYINSQFLLIENSIIISKPFLENTVKWQTDLSQTGEYIKRDGTKAETNEIDGEIFGNEELGIIYVPMAGGQLVALNSENGDIVWNKFYQVSENGSKNSGKYAIWKNKIYKTDGLSLIEVDAVTGDWLKTVNFDEIQKILQSEYYQNERFFATGPVFVYDDVVILYETRNCQILIFSRHSFTLIDFVHIPNIPGIPNSKDVIAWHNNKLYVLDMERTLHIFELEK